MNIRSCLLPLSCCLFFSSSVFAQNLTWSWSDTTQGRSNFEHTFKQQLKGSSGDIYKSECGETLNIDLQIKNNSGTIDIGFIHQSQCYHINVNIDGKKPGDNSFTPINANTYEVCSRQSLSHLTGKWNAKYNEVKITGSIINKNPGFPHLGSAALTFSLDKQPRKQGYILFAHGLSAYKTDFDVYAEAACDAGYEVYRTDVPPCGSIKDRATKLAGYINKLSDVPKKDILKAVAHSMGGLDLRYLIGEGHEKTDSFYQAAQRIAKVYTLATPHEGADIAQMALDFHPIAQLFEPCTNKPAMHDLTSDYIVNTFNKKYTPDTFSIDGREIGFTAFYFHCDMPPPCGVNADCIVGTGSQTWADMNNTRPGASIGPFGANLPHNLGYKHTNLPAGMGAACDSELDSTGFLQTILDDKP